MKNVWLNPRFANSAAPCAIFADRDGTLIQHVDYLHDEAKVELLPGVKQAIQRLIVAQIPFYILTNQSGVGRGYFPIERVHACQQRLFALLEIEPTQLAGWCIAPEAPDTAGGYRKPSPRFIQEACAQTKLSPRNCHMIGDTLVDLETAWKAEAHAWVVTCGKPQLPEQIAAGTRVSSSARPYQTSSSFANCVHHILS